jgi:hypothetical protein
VIAGAANDDQASEQDCARCLQGRCSTRHKTGEELFGVNGEAKTSFGNKDN